MNRKDFLKLLAMLPLTGTAHGLTSLSEMTATLDPTEEMPVFFFGHGSPMNAIEQNEFSQAWQKIGATLPKPNAILCISAHWLTRGTLVTNMEQPRTIHDFGGFPPELFQVQYPAPGSPVLAQATKELIRDVAVGLDNEWGLDHGCWSVVRHLYPEADVPVVQMSIDYHQPAAYHYALARSLADLRKKGILIIGSGNMVHNLSMVAWDKMEVPGYGFDWAIEANDRMKKLILERQHQPLIDFRQQGKAFDLAIPTPDHYYPMIYALALQGKQEQVEFFNDKAVAGSLTMTSFRISRG